MPAYGRRPRFGPTEWVYSRFVLLKTLLALDGLATIGLPEDIRGLVEAVYDDRVADHALVVAAGFDPEDFGDAWAELDRARQRDRSLAQERLLGVPRPTDPFYEGQDVQFEDQDEEAKADRWIAAVTRLGPPNRNVILLHRRDGALYLDAVGGSPLDLDRLPPPWLRRELLLRSVSLSRRHLVQYLETVDPPPGLRDCAALRNHAALALEGGRYAVPGTDLVVRLDPELGVVYEEG
jgi:hypothetical protein